MINRLAAVYTFTFRFAQSIFSNVQYLNLFLSLKLSILIIQFCYMTVWMFDKCLYIDSYVYRLCFLVNGFLASMIRLFIFSLFHARCTFLKVMLPDSR